MINLGSAVWDVDPRLGLARLFVPAWGGAGQEGDTRMKNTVLGVGDYAVVSFALVRAIGAEEALMLQDMHRHCLYREEEGNPKYFHDGRWWMYRTVAEWATMVGVSEKTVDRKLARLRQEGLLFVGKFNRKGYDRTRWYSVNYARLDRLLAADATRQSDPTNTQESILIKADAIYEPSASSENSSAVQLLETWEGVETKAGEVVAAGAIFNLLEQAGDQGVRSARTVFDYLSREYGHVLGRETEGRLVLSWQAQGGLSVNDLDVPDAEQGWKLVHLDGGEFGIRINTK